MVWSIGRHPVDGNYVDRTGINDQRVYNDRIIRPACEQLSSAQKKKLVWIGGHFRRSFYARDERPEQVWNFERNSGVVLQSCPGAHVVSAFALTASATRDLPRSDIIAMNFDGQHWGRAVNILKAQLVVKELVAIRAATASTAAAIATVRRDTSIRLLHSERLVSTFDVGMVLLLTSTILMRRRLMALLPTRRSQAQLRKRAAQHFGVREKAYHI